MWDIFRKRKHSFGASLMLYSIIHLKINVLSMLSDKTIWYMSWNNTLSHFKECIVPSQTIYRLKPIFVDFTLKIDNSIPKKVDFWKRNHPLNHGTASNWQPCNTSHIIITYWRLTTLSISTPCPQTSVSFQSYIAILLQ